MYLSRKNEKERETNHLIPIHNVQKGQAFSLLQYNITMSKKCHQRFLKETTKVEQCILTTMAEQCILTTMAEQCILTTMAEQCILTTMVEQCILDILKRK